MKKLLNVLIVDDAADDAELININLEKNGYVSHYKRVETKEEMLNALGAQQWDIIICDYSMPRFSALEALRVHKEKKLEIPFIIVSGTVGETLAVEAMRAGAHDYVMKDNLARLSPAVERELKDTETRMKRRQAEEALKVAEKEKLLILDSTSEMFMFMNADLIIHWANKAAAAAVGKKTTELIGKHYHDVWGSGKEDFGHCPILRTVSQKCKQEDELILAEGKTWLIRGYPVFAKNENLIGVTAFGQDITARKEAEHALVESEKKYRMVVENANDGILVTHGEYMDFFNPRICEFTGYDVRELKKIPFLDLIHPDDRQMVENRLRRRMTGKDAERFYSIKIIDKSGETHWVEINPERIEWEGKPAVLAFVSEVTEKKRLEEELRQAQKMEAVGRLAGGVAHDFNNLLTVIEGYGDMLIGQTDDGSMMQRGIQQILAAGKRAEALTRQLLTFSRKQVLQPKILNLNALIGETEKMLRRLIGEDVEMVSNLTNELQDIKADPGQIEQVIMNLVINGRDAMPEGGQISIKTSMRDITPEQTKIFNDIKPGQYIQLDIADTGCGIDPQILPKIFEPFFTTKDRGKGTGLGLSTVFGIVKQSKGDIQVKTEPGKGTTFSIFLPCVTQEMYLEEKEASKKIKLEGSETILVVEDEDQVRLLIRKTLQKKGYTVHDADNGNEAVEIFEKYAEDIDLILTDVVMPRMSGRKVADTVLSSNPDKKIVYMSGYTDEAIVRHGILNPGVNFLQKPFSSDELLKKVRDVLDH